MITNAIRNATSKDEVILLLTTYVESARAGGRFQFMADSVTPLPLHGISEARTHFVNLLVELDTASRNFDNHTCDVLHEAVHVYGAGLEQMTKLERRQHARRLAA